MAGSILTYETPKYPRQLRLDTTTNCNAKCLSCHRNLSSRNGSMDLPYAIKILEDVSRWEVPLTELVPVNHGEFFTYKWWWELLETAESLLPKTQIVIPTNGALLSTVKLDKLLQIRTLGLLNFSVNAYLSSTYEEFMSLPASNINHIASIIPQIKESRPDITIWVSMVYDPMYQSEKEKEMFIRKWDVRAVPQIIPASNCNRIPQIIHTSLPCRSIFSDIVIGYDMRITSCCFDADFVLNLGYYNGNLQKSWHNKYLTNFRRTHNEGKRATIQFCRGCSFA